ncbi:hypothetical protein AJ79_01941 [Helicocarpus griseus UAMH5409]|uniref:TauD/TfdA-like domain-containing protein n=1 Tax=Helicocarpus griseus UAMH5409 TaxID=1447875 RepID=A0A2B7XWM1_9EURO|nr:hypothetical protein AJ79_01941 [Helicocarpus griseus UAMH5409]
MSEKLPQGPGVPGVSVIWPALQATEVRPNFRRPGGASRWHTYLVHERQPAGVTHLHNDTVPTIEGDALWASGYAAYEKLSPNFRKIIDGKTAIYRSAHPYLDRNDPNAGPKYVEREQPIVGLDKAESDLILGYLCDVYEKNVDIQVRFKWTPRTIALWDNRITIHNASWDHEGNQPRHGTRVTSLAERPFSDTDAPTRRQKLGLTGPDE